MTKEQYISNWHDNFVNGIKFYMSIASALLLQATNDDKQKLEIFKLMLNGKDARDIEKELSVGTVTHGTLDRIEKLNKDLVDFLFEQKSEFWKMFIKQQCYFSIEEGKKAGMVLLKELGI